MPRRTLCPWACLAWIVATMLCLAPSSLSAQAQTPAPPPATSPTTQGADQTRGPGRFLIRFDRRAQLSDYETLFERFRWKPANPRDYDIKKETFVLLVPKSPPNSTYGLLVYVSPSEQGDPPPDWLPALAQHHLIWIAANQSGNDQPMERRFALAIDAAENLPAHYQIDRDRVYIAGVSGGGRVASMLALACSDVFRGGYYLIGCNYYKDLLVPGDAGHFWRRSFNRPATDMLTLARKRSRFVFLTGDADPNQPQTHATFEAYLRDGFTHSFYFQVPTMGHDIPHAAWFAKGLAALDAQP